MSLDRVEQLVNKATNINPSDAVVADPATASALNLLGVQAQFLAQSTLELTDVVGETVPSLITQASTDQWEDDAQPPAGTRATPYLLKMPEGWQKAKLKQITYWNAFAPTGAETLTLRIYKYIDGGTGGLVLMTDPLVVDSTFDSFTTVDVSNIIRDRIWEPNDVLALSRVYANPNTLQAPLIRWNFELMPVDTPLSGTTPDPATWPAP